MAPLSTRTIKEASTTTRRPNLTPPSEAENRLHALDLDVRQAEATSDGAFAAHQKSIKDYQASVAEKGWSEKAANDAGLELAADVAQAFDKQILRDREIRGDAERTLREASLRTGTRRDLHSASKACLASAPKPLRVVKVRSTPDDGKSPQQTVATLRGGISRLRKEIEPTRKAPQPIDHAKAAFAARVDELASTPRYEVVRNGNTFDLRFPVVPVLAEPVGGLPVAFDPRPAYVAAHRDEILAAGIKAIEEHYEDNVILALSDDAKRSRLAEIAEEILSLERRECAVIWAAREKGEVIDFRPDTDPRAILGIDASPARRR